MEIKIKIKIWEPCQIKEVIELIKKIEKEYSCNCTLLEMDIDFLTTFHDCQSQK